jgi:hypothetical protein
MDNNIGLKWRKADLHIHTPVRNTDYGKKGNEIEMKACWDIFIDKLEELYPEGSIIGINDYDTFGGYKKIKEEYKNRLLNRLILPVIEFRIDKISGHEKMKYINFHIIFSNQIPSEELDNFLKNVEKIEDKDKVKYLEKEKIIDEKGEIRDNILKKMKDKVMFAIGKNEWYSLDNKDISKINLINKDVIHFCFSASPKIENAKKSQNKILENNGLYLHCSDAHNYDTNGDKNLGNCFTWIKSKMSFESLFQVYYEYGTRVKISEDKPIGAIKKIEKMTINFPNEVKIGDNDLCFAGEKIELNFNSALNCIIGGRGVGKSLLLQLLCKNNDNLLEYNENNKNKKETEVIVDKINNWKYFIEIENTDFEYFGQGKIYSIFQDKIKFQNAIKERLEQYWKIEKIDNKTMSESKEEVENSLKKIIKDIEESIKILQKKVENNYRIKENEKRIEINKNVLLNLNSKEYKEIQEEISAQQNLINLIKLDREKFSELTTKINDIKSKTKIVIDNNRNGVDFYAKEYNSIIEQVTSIKIASTDQILHKEKELVDSLNSKQEKLKEYLKSKGMTEVNIYSSIEADNEIKELDRKNKELSNFNEKEIDVKKLEERINTINKEYKDKIEEILDKTKNIDKQKEMELLSFSLEYDKDKSSEFFRNFVKNNMDIEWDDFKSLLNKRTKEQKQKELKYDIVLDIAQKNKGLKTSEKVINFFESDHNNINIYNLTYLLCKKNYLEYGLYNIKYNNKELNDLSFGQRATAIIFIMLLYGNKPIIIDEPETHLDQKVISKELEYYKKSKTK